MVQCAVRAYASETEHTEMFVISLSCSSGVVGRVLSAVSPHKERMSNTYFEYPKSGGPVVSWDTLALRRGNVNLWVISHRNDARPSSRVVVGDVDELAG